MDALYDWPYAQVLHVFLCLFRATEAVKLDIIVIHQSSFPAMPLKALIHFISIIVILQLQVIWQLLYPTGKSYSRCRPFHSSQRSIDFFFFSFLQPHPIHFGLLNIKHFNFCSHFHLDNSQTFPFYPSLWNISFFKPFNQSRDHS